MLSSSISWLDYSNKDRRRVMELLTLFRTQDTRDELGMGTIRDTLADLFFPGTSTLQTKARYFLYVPWIYRTHENRETPSAKIADFLLRDEAYLITKLQEAGENNGVIGQRAGKYLHRFPSSIYWNGLRTWGILHFAGSQDQYHRSLERFYQQRRERSDFEKSPEQVNGLFNWDPALPPAPNPYWASPTFELTYPEAKYLQERLVLSCRQSSLAYLAEMGQAIPAAKFLWELPQCRDFPTELRDSILQAQNFSECMVGASLLYNYQLARMVQNDTWCDRYTEALEAWRVLLATRINELASWQLQELWILLAQQGRTISSPTRHFVHNWVRLLFDKGSIAYSIEQPEMVQLVIDREMRLKGSRSRFASSRHRETWNGASGAGQLDFRWGIAKDLLEDIIAGLGRVPNAKHG